MPYTGLNKKSKKHSVSQGFFQEYFVKSKTHRAHFNFSCFFAKSWLFGGLFLDGFRCLFWDFCAKKALGKSTEFNSSPKRIWDDFWLDFDAFWGYFLDDFSNYAKSSFSMTIPCEMAVFRSRNVRKKNLKSKRFLRRVSEPTFWRKWGPEVSPRGPLNSKLAVPGKEKRRKEKGRKTSPRKKSKKEWPGCPAPFFLDKTSKMRRSRGGL